MKKIILLITMCLYLNILYSQSYYYGKRTESVKYIDSNGRNTSKIIKTNTGNFKLEFEKNNIDGKDLFTEYINNNDMGYYSLSQKYSNKEFNGNVYEQGLFYSTDYGSGVIVLFSLNKDKVVMFKGDKIIQYHN